MQTALVKTYRHWDRIARRGQPADPRGLARLRTALAPLAPSTATDRPRDEVPR